MDVQAACRIGLLSRRLGAEARIEFELVAARYRREGRLGVRSSLVERERIEGGGEGPATGRRVGHEGEFGAVRVKPTRIGKACDRSFVIPEFGQDFDFATARKAQFAESLRVMDGSSGDAPEELGYGVRRDRPLNSNRRRLEAEVAIRARAELDVDRIEDERRGEGEQPSLFFVRDHVVQGHPRVLTFKREFVVEQDCDDPDLRVDRAFAHSELNVRASRCDVRVADHSGGQICGNYLGVVAEAGVRETLAGAVAYFEANLDVRMAAGLRRAHVRLERVDRGVGMSARSPDGGQHQSQSQERAGQSDPARERRLHRRDLLGHPITHVRACPGHDACASSRVSCAFSLRASSTSSS